MRGTMRIAGALLWLVWFLPACDGGGGDADGGPDGGADTDPDCAEGDTFDEADCPQTYPDYSCVVYVDGSLGASGDGFSWDGARRTVQEGLDLARCGVLKTSVCDQWQVWVRAGRYHVHQGCREHTLRLREDVGLYGGFAGGESALEQRDWDANQTILDGANAQDAEQRVFHVVTADDSTRLDGFTVSGGLADGSGDDSSVAGGGLFVGGKQDVSLSNCVIRENEGVEGSGLVVGSLADLSIQTCVFEQNRAFRPSEDFPYPALGAGIYAVQADLVIEDSVFRGNTVEEVAGLGGSGAIHAWQMTRFEVDGTLFENNSVSGNAAGGLWVFQTNAVSLTDSTFRGNTAATWGGGVLLQEIESVEISGCAFENNTAAVGGGIAFSGCASVIVEDCEFSGNESSETGGAVYGAESTLDITGGLFSSNRSAMTGGAVSANQATIAMEDSTFSDNTAAETGGAIASWTSTVTMTGSTFSDNEAETAAGGAIFGQTSGLDIQGSVFQGNATGGGGGAIYGVVSCAFDISDTSFSGNTARDAGGALLFGNFTPDEAPFVVTIQDSVFSGNVVDGDPPNAGFGGALFAQFAEVELRGAAFEDNEASNAGGAVLVESLSALDIEACVFARNSAGIDGGALMLYDSPASLRSSLLVDNAAAYGGAVCLATDDEPLPTSIDIRGATFFGNTATEAGGAVYARTGTVSAGNSIFRGDAPDVFAWDDGVDPAVATYCAVQGGWTGAGNLDADPLFTDAAAGNFRLLPGSPCLDAADGTAATEFDIDGLPRFDDPLAPNTGLGPPWADIGAHERQP